MTLPTTIGVIVLWTVGVSLFGLIAGLVLLGIDRKIAAHMQARIGPPLRQPFIDIRKLLVKENIVPENAIPWIFNLAPIIALVSSLVILLYIPLGSLNSPLGMYGDLILVMYLLTIPALAMVAGGFASGSPYATVGAQREMVTMIGYEFPLAIVVIAIAWRLWAAGVAYPFLLSTIAGNPVWGLVGPLGFIGVILLLIVLAVVTPAELSRIPFDTQEAETELAGGLLVEYSGRNLALFSLATAVKTLVLGALIVAVFFPWNLSSFVAMPAGIAQIADLAFFLFKVILVMSIAVTLVRVGMARFRINQVVRVYWITFALIGLAGLLLLMADSILAGVF
ncbi:MAG TPA: NADH-quinone oxidoreductase subunit H [Methanoregulaceae archaeon]|nr:MAG: NADH-quinone oxidoreductase subunit H [Methanolinea sp.]HON81116.1 NADH-quinone oxidoreductase subunit H [Methanoregulaceae archaeon]HPD09940.1 NADH-quinone oxidoreductase subunit H [Methanoregulaceae archaeon]HRT14869.1 NADH-quinone oxidoreductase subunit H [Methanoregulaceae archaeon]HRU30516.1 NADH-quinone oxidoreductase subunit H [Methanoregulaceae archaeon]